MFIETVKIERYGPIEFKRSIQLSPFTLFFGQNETGKSLTIDALVKFLVGKESSGFYKINRVDEYPNGFLIVNFDGERAKLPEKGNLKVNADINLEASDFKNVFIVRSSSLAIPDGSNFFLEVTERLTGIKATIIDEVNDKIREIASLTPGNNFKDVRGIQLKSRIERAGKIIGEIDLVLRELQTQDFDRLVQIYVDKEEKLEEIERRLSDLNNAKFRDEYIKAIQALSELKKIKNDIDSYSIYTEDARQKWYDFIKEKERKNIEIENDQNKLDNLKLKIDNLKKEFNKSNQELSILTEKMDKINRLIPQIEELSEKDSDLEKEKIRKEKIFKPLFYVSIFNLLVTIVLSIFTHIVIFGVFGITFFLFSLGMSFVYPIKKSNLRKSFRKMMNLVSGYGIKSDDSEFKDLLYSVQKFEDYFNQKKKEVDDYKNELEVMNRLYKDLEGKIDKNRESLNKIEEDINLFKERYRVSSYREYCDKLNRRKDLNNRQVINQNFLKKIFLTQIGENKENRSKLVVDEGNFTFWEKKVKSLEKYKDLAENVEYDQVEYESLIEKREKIKSEKDTLSRKLDELKSSMENMEREVNSILHTGPDHLYLSNLADLEKAKELLKNFIESNNRKRRLAILAIQTFDEIKRKKREEISGIFRNNNEISDLYKEISGGKYQEVIYNSDESKILVKDKKGIILDVDKLSSGAYDQLYFTIRLALAEKLLGNSSGFFILDDPFIRSDKQRLIRQLKTLENIVKMGWQILYFSAKDEVRDVLESNIKDIDVSILEMNKEVMV